MSESLSTSPRSEKKRKISPESTWKVWLRIILCYLFFSVVVLLAIFILFRLRLNIIQIGFLLGYNQVKVKGISNLGVMISGLILLGGIVFSEDYLRRGIEKGLVMVRGFRLIVIEIALIGLSMVLYYVIFMLAG